MTRRLLMAASLFAAILSVAALGCKSAPPEEKVQEMKGPSQDQMKDTYMKVKQGMGPGGRPGMGGPGGMAPGGMAPGGR